MGIDIEKAPGLYKLLERIGVGDIWSSDSNVMTVISREEVCQTTGGSCMELKIREFSDDGSELEGKNIHVTDGDEILRSGSYTYTKNNGLIDKPEKPSWVEMRASLLELVDQ